MILYHVFLGTRDSFVATQGSQSVRTRNAILEEALNRVFGEHHGGIWMMDGVRDICENHLSKFENTETASADFVTGTPIQVANIMMVQTTF
jgi:hypothetical protein